MQNFANILKSSPPTQERLTLAQKFDEVFESSDLAIKLEIVVFEAMVKAINPLLPVDKRLSEEQLKQVTNDMKTQLQQTARNGVLMGFLYAYRNVSDAELKEYIGFYESETGRWFVRVMNGAVLKVIEESSAEMMGEMAGFMKEKYPKGLVK
jgi:hypothetical protein